MKPQAYETLSPGLLLALCVWRESQDQPPEGQRGVAHVVANRAARPSWWGHDIPSVILHPGQFSSFNAADPNSNKWPWDDSPIWHQCVEIAQDVLDGTDMDPTAGATYYHDTSIEWPEAWGPEGNYELTLSAGRLLFYRPVARVPLHPDLASET